MAGINRGAYLIVEIYESIEKNVFGCINWRQTAQLSKTYQFSGNRFQTLYFGNPKVTMTGQYSYV